MPSREKSINSPQNRPKPLRRKHYIAKLALEQTTARHVGRPAGVDVDLVKELASQGLGCAEIARAIGCSKQVAWTWMQRLEAMYGGWNHDWDKCIPTRYLFSGVDVIKTHPVEVVKRAAVMPQPAPTLQYNLAIFSVRVEVGPDGKQKYAYTGQQIVTSTIPAGELGVAIQAVQPIPEDGIVVTANGENWYVVSQSNQIARKHFSHTKHHRDNGIRQIAQEAAAGGLIEEYRYKQAANAIFGGK